ncbi:hypothetical protein ACWEKM_44640 [Streptomyces sp. NPDC004752]
MSPAQLAPHHADQKHLTALSKGRVERQVLIVRDHVLAGQAFSSIEEMDAVFMAWVPQRRARTHATHHEVIGHRAARDHAALKPLPPTPYLVAERQLRHVGKDCLVAFDGNLVLDRRDLRAGRRHCGSSPPACRGGGGGPRRPRRGEGQDRQGRRPHPGPAAGR